MNEQTIKMLEDDLQNRIKQRESVDVNSDEFSLLTQMIANNCEEIIKAEKALMDHQIAEEKIKQEKQQKDEEMKFKWKQLDDEISIRAEENEEKIKQFEREIELKEAEMRQKQEQFEDELEARKALERKRNLQILTATAITAVGGIVCVALKINHENDWIPKLMEFEVNNSFSYTAAKEITKKIFKQ